ncbi:hypothetical protein NXS19_006763 [Fusarium pseudograminearum]|nr:hypothetical protein NXS19_006763 [Fusarium pseudograminearum]
MVFSGYILLFHGTPLKSVRIVVIREIKRGDMQTGVAPEVNFVRTDISSITSTGTSFKKPCDPLIQSLTLTVFHKAAIIIPPTRSKHFYMFFNEGSVQGTKKVLAASRAISSTP